MSVKIRNHLFCLLLMILYGGFITESSATHISKPVIQQSKIDYRPGEKIVLNGWAEYNEQPTSDVLLNVKVFRPDGSELLNQSFLSDEKGSFRFEVETDSLKSGNYRVVITSHCREMHRSICTYRNETLLIHLH